MTSDPENIQKVRKPMLQYDIALLFPVLFLVGIGIVMVYSASSALALKKFGTSYYFLKNSRFLRCWVLLHWWSVTISPIGFFVL